ncbi:hypothetical protein ACTQ6A_02855 [Lachnospiraceae bacterium LCP25S3_G4]
MFTGKIVNISRDYESGKAILSFEFNEDVTQRYEQLKDVDKLNIEFKKYTQKRSLNANAYFHVLVGKIADVLRASKPSIKNNLLNKHGQLEIVDGKLQNFIVRDDIDVSEYEEVHLRPTSHTKEMADGQVYRVYYLVRGSHTYNTEEMSILIDGTVSEAKELGIETYTPDQIERLKRQWKVEL